MGRENILRDKQCIGQRTNLKFYFDYIQQFAKAYHKTGFFGFNFFAEYSHDVDRRILSKIDLEFYNFLKEYKRNTDLYGNTILVIFSDHGPRYTYLRKSVYGLLNERNAFFSIYFPKSFQDKYPTEFKNFKSNTDKLVSPMDIHRTFMDLIDLETGKKQVKIKEWFKRDKRSMSLFDKIQSSRTCEQAGISAHWCACLKRTRLNLNNKKNFKISQLLGNFFINFLNNELLVNNLDECEILKVKKIEKIYLLDTYIDSKHKSGLQVDPRLLQAPAIEKDYRKYYIQLETSPNNGTFESTIIGEVDLNRDVFNFQINKNEISRINKYKSDPHCIYDRYPDLRKFCYCKNKKFK